MYIVVDKGLTNFTRLEYVKTEDAYEKFQSSTAKFHSRFCQKVQREGP